MASDWIRRRKLSSRADEDVHTHIPVATTGNLEVKAPDLQTVDTIPNRGQRYPTVEAFLEAWLSARPKGVARP